MSRPFIALLALALAAPAARAQEAAGGEPIAACTTPDTVLVRGNARVSAERIRGEAGLTAAAPLNYRDVQRAIRTLFATGEFSDVRIICETAGPDRAQLVIQVAERPLLAQVNVAGVNRVSPGSVRDRIEIPVGRAADPAQVARAVARIDSLYAAQGYYLTRVQVDSATVEGGLALTFRVLEGNRVAVAGVLVEGNERISDETIVDHMKTKPEGFWWFRKGAFDEDEYARDIGERIPELYAARGLIDAQVVSDTVIVDRERGKALINVGVLEGPRYYVGDFDIAGNRRFPTEELRRFFPFDERDRSLREQVTGLFRGGEREPGVPFDATEWEEATSQLRTAYSNEGYIYAQIRPVVDRAMDDSVPRVNLRWEINEGSPAIINRVDIVGNDYTDEACIRDALILIPGQVFNQDALVRSWQNIGNLGFFEQPPPPETRPANEEGDIDIIFRVKEKRTGNINFGASVGGYGAGGFFGLDQPNLFGKCKRVSLQWQFGRYINDFSLSYTDPNIQQSRISGTVSAYHRNLRYTIGELGRVKSTGGSVQLGFPVPRSPFTRLFVQYGLETQKYEDGLFERDTSTASLALRCDDCLRSTLGATLQRDTRVDLPFATAGALQSFTARFNGGPLGGTANFQKYTTELKSYTPLWQLGGTTPGSQPIKFVLGLSARGGAIFGGTGPFYTEKFALGGVQFGEPLRGYEEFSVTPAGFVPGTSDRRANLASFGNAFFTASAEIGVRFNQMIYVNAFYDAGNVWNRPREINPTRLFRGAGIGASLVTPLGPLGLDWAYGFDRVDEFGRPDPKWTLHFKLGNIF